MTRVRSTSSKAAVALKSAPAAAAAAKKKKKTAAKPQTARNKDDVKLSAFVARALKSTGPGPYELAPGRYAGTVSLPQVLAQLGTTPQGQQAVGQLLATLKEKTGVTVSPEVQAALLSNPSGATTALEMTPRQLSLGVLSLNAAYQAGKVKPVPPRATLLPPTGFELAAIGALDVKRETPKLKQVAPGLFTGSLPSALPDAQVRQNRVMAEVFDRLARNASAEAGHAFSVQYQGQGYARLDDFLAALKANGHEVKVTFEQRAANFADLKTPVPHSNPPQWLDVPAPLMLRTGIKDAAGKEAIIPAAHSEMIITVSSGPQTAGPKLDSVVRYYQGVDGTGFFPRGASDEPKWLGRVTHGEVVGDDALKAVAIAGALGDVIGTSAKAANLYADGYGVTGVCNDSVAVVQQALMGRADQYPLFMRDDVLFGELKKRLSDADLRDDPIYTAIRKAIEELPSDVQQNATTRARALKSIPWAEGAEPFDSTIAARAILATAPPASAAR